MHDGRHMVTLFTLAGLILVVTLISFGILGGGSPTLAAPAPLLLFVAMAFVGPLAFAIPAVLFLCWAWPLSRGQARFPTRSLVLILILVVLSVAWHVKGDWRQYYGLGMAYIWLGYVSFVVGGALMCRLRPRFWLNAAAHWLLFAWLASYAFPWYGEVP